MFGKVGVEGDGYDGTEFGLKGPGGRGVGLGRTGRRWVWGKETESDSVQGPPTRLESV